jgi:hypothetical protein
MHRGQSGDFRKSGGGRGENLCASVSPKLLKEKRAGSNFNRKETALLIVLFFLNSFHSEAPRLERKKGRGRRQKEKRGRIGRREKEERKRRRQKKEVEKVTKI